MLTLHAVRSTSLTMVNAPLSRFKVRNVHCSNPHWWVGARQYTHGRIFEEENPCYDFAIKRLEAHLRKNPHRRLTLAEKILYSHLADEEVGKDLIRGESYVKLIPDRVAMQDASAQTALLQFMLSGRCDLAVPTSIHCDHLIQAYEGQVQDLKNSMESNKEILDFLEQSSKKYGIELWRPGSGIIHQIVLENYAIPGTLMLGTDSHTPNAGGLGMLAIGVGGADAVDAISGIPWELKMPKILGVHLKGSLNGWAKPKDLILHLVGKLGVNGGANHIVEYFGPGVETLSCTGMATVCNMGAEMGATTSVFPYTQSMSKYLECTGRPHIAKAAEAAKECGYLSPDQSCEYNTIIEVNLSELEPCLNGPFSPDISTPISKFKEYVEKNKWEDKIDAALIGSCTNSSYEDISGAAFVASQATSRNLLPKSNLLVALGSDRIHSTVERDHLKDKLVKAGAVILANACGPCIGQWKRKDLTEERPNSIVTSFNRNFRARNDGFSQTRNFLASPEIVAAMSYSGRLTFDPTRDSLIDGDGIPFSFEPPKKVDLPVAGFVKSAPGMQSNTGGRPDPSVEVCIDPKSTRLQVLSPFPKWDGKEFTGMRVLLKPKGKCTTDHISPAGKWLKYKGHLENISKNTFIGAFNEFTNSVNLSINEHTGEIKPTPAVAEDYKKAGVPWMVVAETNYGEGSAREHAALQPRFLGCKLILAKSFARIHETNLKKQGIIPVTFADPDDWYRIVPNCLVKTIGLVDLDTSQSFQLMFSPVDSDPFIIKVNHTFSPDQILWFKAGSALNLISDVCSSIK